MLAGSEHRRHGIDYGRVHEIIMQMGPLLDFNIPWQRSTVNGLHQQLLPEKAGFIPRFHRQMKTGNASNQWESRKEGLRGKEMKRQIWYGRAWDMFFIPKHITNAFHPVPAVDKNIASWELNCFWIPSFDLNLGRVSYHDTCAPG